ncbi:hypothetical protein ACW2Q0_00695 [Nocardia sp. R16R-3T]
MTAELATIDDSQLMPTLPVDPFDTLNRYTDMLAKSLKFAQDICRTSLVPKIYQGKPGDAAVAILHGAELGLHPLQALQNVFPVHGMPSIYAKTMVALLRQKGYRFKTIESGPERVVFQGWSPNGEETEPSEWTIERATKAGFVPTIDPATGKYKTKKFDGQNGPYEKLIGNEKYITQPEEMLWAKAATTVCKRLAPHILLGLAVAEDQEDRTDDLEPVRVASERVSVADIVTDGTGTAVPVTQWTPPEPEPEAVDSTPDAAERLRDARAKATEAARQAQAETASSEGEKPDNAQVDDSAKASPEPVAEASPTDKPSTRTQQKKIARLLNEQGVEDDGDKLVAIGKFFEREIGSADDITWDEAIRLLDYLERDDPATEGQAAAVTEGGAQ